MPIDPRLPLQVREVQVLTPLEQSARVAELQGTQLEQQAKIKALKDQEAIQQVFQQHVAQGGDPEDVTPILGKVYGIDPILGNRLQQQMEARRASKAKAQLEESKARHQQIDDLWSAFGGVLLAAPERRAELYKQKRGELLQAKMPGAETLPEDLDEEMVKAGFIGANHAKGQLEAMGLLPARAQTGKLDPLGLFMAASAREAGLDDPSKMTVEQLTGALKNYHEASAKAADEKLGSDYHQFLKRFAESKGTTIEKLTSAQELEGRKLFGQADDAARRPLAPVVIQTPTGYMQVDRERGGVATPITAGGQQIPLAPTSEMRNAGMSFERAKPVLQSIGDLSERINTQQGVIAKISGAVEQAKAKANLNNDVAEYNALIEAYTPLVARSLGHTGVLTQRDVDSIKGMFPQPGDSKALRDRKVVRLSSMVEGVQRANEAFAPPPPGARTPAPTFRTGDKKPAPNGQETIEKYGAVYQWDGTRYVRQAK